MLSFMLSGAGIGLTAGLSPGPLMTLVVAESLRGGWPAGFRVSLAPLVTDLLFILSALLLAAPLPAWGMSLVSVVGGLVIIWMGLGTTRSAGSVQVRTDLVRSESGGGSIWKGILTNLLNPNAFLFWLTAGTSILREAFVKAGWVGPLLFMAAFFGVLISINTAIAVGVSRGRSFLQGPGYQWALRLAGLMLVGLGAWRAWVGVQGL